MSDVGCRSSDMSDVGCRTLRCQTLDAARWMSVVGYVVRRMSDVAMSDVGYSDVGCRMSDIRTSDVGRLAQNKMAAKKKWPPRLGSKKGQIIFFVFRICRTLDVGRRICRTSDVGRNNVGRRIFGRRMSDVGYSDVGYCTSDMSNDGSRTSVNRNGRFWHKKNMAAKKKMARQD